MPLIGPRGQRLYCDALYFQPAFFFFGRSPETPSLSMKEGRRKRERLSRKKSELLNSRPSKKTYTGNKTVFFEAHWYLCISFHALICPTVPHKILYYIHESLIPSPFPLIGYPIPSPYRHVREDKHLPLISSSFIIVFTSYNSVIILPPFFTPFWSKFFTPIIERIFYSHLVVKFIGSSISSIAINAWNEISIKCSERT